MVLSSVSLGFPHVFHRNLSQTTTNFHLREERGDGSFFLSLEVWNLSFFLWEGGLTFPKKIRRLSHMGYITNSFGQVVGDTSQLGYAPDITSALLSNMSGSAGNSSASLSGFGPVATAAGNVLGGILSGTAAGAAGAVIGGVMNQPGGLIGQAGEWIDGLWRPKRKRRGKGITYAQLKGFKKVSQLLSCWGMVPQKIGARGGRAKACGPKKCR